MCEWKDVSVDGYPNASQEVLMVRGGETVWGAWLGKSFESGGAFWCGGKKVAALYWMPMPEPKRD